LDPFAATTSAAAPVTIDRIEEEEEVEGRPMCPSLGADVHPIERSFRQELATETPLSASRGCHTPPQPDDRNWLLAQEGYICIVIATPCPIERFSILHGRKNDTLQQPPVPKASIRLQISPKALYEPLPEIYVYLKITNEMK
jgi:hypothetical protein